MIQFRKFLCKIGRHKWEIISESENIGLELLFLFMMPYGRRFKCKYCGKIK